MQAVHRRIFTRYRQDTLLKRLLWLDPGVLKRRTLPSKNVAENRKNHFCRDFGLDFIRVERGSKLSFTRIQCLFENNSNKIDL